jgi:hypothetical protein
MNFFNMRVDQRLNGGILGPEALGYDDMAWTVIVEPVYRPVGSLVLAVGRADLSFYRTVTQFAAQTPVYALLLYSAGLVPATWFNVAAVPLTYLFMLRPTPGSFSLDYIRSFLPAVSLALGMAIAVRLLATTPVQPRIGMLAARLALGAVLYGGTTFLFRRGDVGELAGIMVSRS